MKRTGTILVADDDAAIRTVLRQALQRAGHEVRTTDSAAGLSKLVADGTGDVIITDVRLPDADGLEMLPGLLAKREGLPVIVISAQNTLATAVRATERGAFEYLPKPFDLNELTAAVQSALEQAGRRREPMPKAEKADELPLIGRSPAMQEVYRLIARVVPTDLTVMVLGESGTGKELVARAIHDLGPRRTEPFVAINMAAIPRDLIETELFGHERGAFTGAQARSAGRFEQAQGGTLFLDEIGDMPIEAQTRLLRVLQSGEFTTVGGARTIRTNVRIICATHKDLERAIDRGQFREDLYYRLNVVPIALPPLRARRDDIAELTERFLERAVKDGLPRKVLTGEAIEVLRAQDWPGNVRELENVARRLAALARDEVLDAAAARQALGSRSGTPAPSGEHEGLALSVENRTAALLQRAPNGGPAGLYEAVMAEVEPPLLGVALAATGGNQIKAAKMLGINRNTLRARLAARGLDPAAFRPRRDAAE